MTALTEAQAAAVARGIAAEAGLVLEADALAAVTARLTVDLGLEEDGSIVFDIPVPFTVERGQVIDRRPLGHATAIVREFGSPIAAPASTPGTEAAGSGPVQRSHASARQGPAHAAARDTEFLREAEAHGNPWIAGKINRTFQAAISRLKPDLAARYKREANI